MNTEYLTSSEVDRAAAYIRQGECVAFQTETVYGLGADARNEAAVQKIYQAKGRPSDNPLIIHVSSIHQALEYARDVSDQAMDLMESFWPGPLTLILKKKDDLLAESVTAGLDTVGVRCPASSIARELIEQVGHPIAAPSANTSGRPSPTTAQHVKADLDGKIAAILDSGPAEVGLESTIIDTESRRVPVILRPGGLSRERLEEKIGPVSLSKSQVEGDASPQAPGMKYTHYSPEQDLYILDGPLSRWEEIIQQMKDQGEGVGVVVDDHLYQCLSGQYDQAYSLGPVGDSRTASSRLFDALRSFKLEDVSIILAQAYSLDDLGLAYMNRLEKAAGYRYL